MFIGRWETIAGRFSPQPVYTYPDSFENEGFWSVFKKKRKKEEKYASTRNVFEWF